MELAYPTCRGIAIHPRELSLPESILNPEAQRNFNNHHLEFTRKMFGKQILYFTLRSLDRLQLYLPVDQHDYLHTEYEPPKMPTPIEALTEIEKAHDAGEQLHIRNPGKGCHGYSIEPLTDEILKKCIASYNTLKRGQH